MRWNTVAMTKIQLRCLNTVAMTKIQLYHIICAGIQSRGLKYIYIALYALEYSRDA
jgi:hypothetical protein